MGSVKGSSFIAASLFLISVLFSGAAQGQTLQLDPSRIFEGLLPTPRPQAVPVQSGPKMAYQGFMYVEPNQMRFEVLIDPASAQKAVGLEVTDSLDDVQRAALKAALDAKAPSWCQANGKQHLIGRFAGAVFIPHMPGEGDATPLLGESPEDILVGLSWSFAMPPDSTGLDLLWEGYFQGQKELPIQIFYGGKTESVVATEEVSVLEWRPEGRLPIAMPLLPVPSLDLPPPWRLPLASILCFSSGLFVFLWCTLRHYQLPGGSLAFFSAWLVGALLTWPLLVVKIPGNLKKALPTEVGQAERIVIPLLRNVYRTYDHGTDAEILTFLTRSLAGKAILPVHGEINSDLLYNQEPASPRLRLSELNVKVHQMRQNPQGTGFIVTCSYQGKADGLYWGEAVDKEFSHKAEVDVSAGEGVWKITKIEKTP